MGSVLRIPLYTYYDNNAVNKQSSVSIIMDDAFTSRIKAWRQGGNHFEWTGEDITDIPTKVNNALGFPLLSKKSGQFFLPIPTDTNPEHDPPYPTIIVPWVTDVLNRCYIDYQLHTGITNPMPSKVYNSDNNVNLTIMPSQQVYGEIRYRGAEGVTAAYMGNYLVNYSIYNSIVMSNINYQFQFQIYPEDIIIGNKFNPEYKQGGSHANDSAQKVVVEIRTTRDDDNPNRSVITRVYVYFSFVDYFSYLPSTLSALETIGSSAQWLDTSNPYGEGGSATVGGGDGTMTGDQLDDVNATEVPSLPSLSAVDTGFISLYNPTKANLKALYNFLWSNLFDLATFKKLFADPMECIISLGILPCVPASSGSTDIMFGNINSGVNATELSSQFAQVDCGSVDIEKYVGSFLDYSPYVKISLFLPYIGFVHLGTDDLMGASINVTYNIDCLSGECIAYVSHSERGVLYSYTGNCRAELPITGQNYANSLKNYYEQLSGIIPATVNGAQGGAAGAAAGAIGSAINAGMNVALNNKPDFQRSGSCAGSSGMIGVQTPFVIIERPRYSVPYQVEKFVGQTSNITMTLGDCHGFTACEYVHLDRLNATSEEILEIESMLYKGVIL